MVSGTPGFKIHVGRNPDCRKMVVRKSLTGQEGFLLLITFLSTAYRARPYIHYERPVLLLREGDRDLRLVHSAECS